MAHPSLRKVDSLVESEAEALAAGAASSTVTRNMRRGPRDAKYHNEGEGEGDNGLILRRCRRYTRAVCSVGMSHALERYAHT